MVTVADVQQDSISYVRIEILNAKWSMFQIHRGDVPPTYTTRRPLFPSSIQSSSRQGPVDLQLSDNEQGDALYGLWPFRIALNWRQNPDQNCDTDIQLVVSNLKPGDKLWIRGEGDGVSPAHIRFYVQGLLTGWEKILDSNISNIPQYHELPIPKK